MENENQLFLVHNVQNKNKYNRCYVKNINIKSRIKYAINI